MSSLVHLVHHLATVDQLVQATALSVGVSSSSSSSSGVSDRARERDQQLASVVQTLFEGSQQESFLEGLNAYIKSKDAEIELMAKTHYEGFVTSVDQLLGVRGDVLELKQRILELNSLLQGSAATLLQHHGQLTRYLRILTNMSKAQLVIQTCLHSIELADKVSSLIADKKYYSALKTIDKLQATNEPLIDSYEFARMLRTHYSYRCPTFLLLPQCLKFSSLFLSQCRNQPSRLEESNS